MPYTFCIFYIMFILNVVFIKLIFVIICICILSTLHWNRIQFISAIIPCVIIIICGVSFICQRIVNFTYLQALMYLLLCVIIADIDKCNERTSEPSAGEQVVIQSRSQWSTPCSFTGSHWFNLLDTVVIRF